MIILRIQDILLGILVVMTFKHRYAPVDMSSLWQYILAGLIYFLARSVPSHIKKHAACLILTWGICEVIIVLLQKWNLVCSNHSLFEMTGTFGNPGPLGGFLGILCAGVANVAYRRIKNKDIWTLVWIATSVFLLYGVVASGSRSGLLAASMGIIVIFIKRVKSLVRDGRTRKAVVECVLVSTGVVLAAFILYRLKPHSADGRVLVWLNTLRLMSEHPLMGWGTGGWTANYMLYQADFFAAHPDSSFAMLADNVAYPYNEILHIGAEHGLVGMVLFVWIIIESVRMRPSNCLSETLQISFWAFVVFSLFSYPFDVVKLMVLSAFLMGALELRPVCVFRLPLYMRRFSFFIVTVCLSASCVHFYGLQERAWHDPDLFPYFRYNPDIMYMHVQKGTMADGMDKSDMLDEISFLCPDSEIYCWQGDDKMDKGDFDKAERFYRTAINMVPSRITPRYKLFKLYLSKGDTASAVSLGNEISSLKLKTGNTRSLRMKGEVMRIMEELK